MVQVRAHQPINDDGSINLEAWLGHVLSVDPALDRDALREACEFAREAEQQANATSAAGLGSMVGTIAGAGIKTF